MADIGTWIRKSYEENYRLITTDRKLQSFMVCVFSFLMFTILCCEYYIGYGRVAEYYSIAESVIAGTFNFQSMGLDISPITILLLVPLKLFSPDLGIYCILFSIYGFAFYMLGGHFILKYCRDSGFSEKDAYILLLITFVCAFTDLTIGTGPFASALVIIALWFYNRNNYLISFSVLALAIATGFYQMILFIILVIRTNDHQALPGIIIGMIGGLLTLTFLFWRTPLDTVSTTAWFLLIAAAGLSVLYGLAVKHHPETRTAALAAEIVLCILMLVSYQQYTAFVWIAMLYPMTRMTSTPFQMQRIQYASLAILGLLALVCNHSDFEVFPYLRAAALLLFTVLLCWELWSVTRTDLEK